MNNRARLIILKVTSNHEKRCIDGQRSYEVSESALFSAYNVSRLFARFYEQQLKSFGLTYSQYLVLLALWERNLQTLHEIGKQLKLSSNTLTLF